MRLTALILPAALLLAAALGSCASDNLEDLSGKAIDVPCDTTAVATFSIVVKPIIQRNCIRCHAAGGIGTVGSGFNYETAAGVKAAVTAGRLIGVIEHKTGFSPMPKDIQPEKIPACDIARIKQWVRRGSPND